MAILTHDARSLFAKELKDGSLHVAWGAGNSFWGTSQTHTAALSSNKIEINKTGTFGYNRVVNGTFVANADNWTASSNATAAVASGAVTVTNDSGSDAQISQDMRLDGGATYLCKGQAAAGQSSGVSAKVEAVDRDGTQLGTASVSSTTMSNFSFTFSAPADGVVSLRLIADTNTATNTAKFDGIQMLDAGDLKISGLVVKSSNGNTTYTKTTDYTEDLTKGVVTRVTSGSIGATDSLLLSFTVEPAVPNPTAGSLLSEIGRKRVTDVDYVIPDTSGSVTLTQGNYTVVEYPTRYVYVRTLFAFDDSETATIRETGLFLGTETLSTLPAGQTYFEPSEVTKAGEMITLDNMSPVTRSATVRETVAMVVTL